MTTMYSIRQYKPSDEEDWDLFCKDAKLSSFLLSRRFLSYHRERFVDQSLIITSGDTIVGVFPAAKSPSEATKVVSHPGSTYGGLILSRKVTGCETKEILISIKNHYERMGFESLVYKVLPQIYREQPWADDEWVFHALGWKNIRVDLASVIDLEHEYSYSSRRIRGIRKAQKLGVSVEKGPDRIDEIWLILSENLRDRHNASPVHSLDEIKLLAGRFEKELKFYKLMYEGRVLAAVVVFANRHVWHAQYICSNNNGRSIGALDFLFDAIIKEARECNVRWFDFGISTEHNGFVLNSGLDSYKREFGSGSIIYKWMEWSLKN